MHRFSIVACIFAIILFGTNVETGYTRYLNEEKERSRRALYDNMEIEFTEEDVLEYGKGIWESNSLVDSYENGSLTVSRAAVDLSQVGVTNIRYTVSAVDRFGQTMTKSYNKLVRVRDTVGPTIDLKDTSVTITEGDGFSVNDYLLSVYDKVDGNLEKGSELANGNYTVTSNVDSDTPGNYEVRVAAMDANGNTSERVISVKVESKPVTYVWEWNGSVLNPVIGTIMGPSGKETYYNLPMGGVIDIMRRMGNTDPYWIRSDGVKMLGDYVMIAADLSIRPRGSYVMTSLGMGIVCDTGTFIYTNPYQIDIAVDW